MKADDYCGASPYSNIQLRTEQLKKEQITKESNIIKQKPNEK